MLKPNNITTDKDAVSKRKMSKNDGVKAFDKFVQVTKRILRVPKSEILDASISHRSHSAKSRRKATSFEKA